MVRLGSSGAQASFNFATIGAVPPWKVKSGRSTWGKARMRANKNSSKKSSAQRHHFMKNPTILPRNLFHSTGLVNGGLDTGNDSVKCHLPIEYAADLTPVVAGKEAGASWNARGMESALDF